MSTLYVLQLEDDKWYVGKTDDVSKRLEQHLNGKGSAWTKEYSPVRIAQQRPITSIHDETNTTLDLMKKYGIDNVRGGAYCQVDLSDEIQTSIKHQINSNTDKCYNCGMKGHFANKCPKKEESEEEVEIWGCEYCDREFDTKYGCMIHERSCKTKNTKKVTETKVVEKQSGSCYRCGRKGHWATSCYARTHVEGYELDSDDE
jgi:predicted GIY-YIG superfamily endonuclease